MTDQSLQQLQSRNSRPVIREFIGAAALLVAVVVVSTVLTEVVEYFAVADATTDAATGPRGGSTDRVVFAVIVAGLGAAVVGVGSWLFRERVATFDSLEESALFRISGVIGLVLFVVAYLSVGVFDAPLPDIVFDLVGPVTMGGLAIGYLQYRDAPLQLGLPDGEALPTVLGVGGVAVIAGSGQVVLSYSARNGVFGSFFRPSVSFIDILLSVGIVGILGGAGFALLYTAAVQGRLRTVTQPANAVVAVTTLLAVRSWAIPELRLLIGSGGRSASPSLFGPSIVVAVAAITSGIVAAWVFAYGLETLRHEIDRDVTPLVAGIGVVCVLTFAVSIAAGIRGYGIGFVWGVASLSAVSAAGSVGFERTRSVWVPALAFGAYWLLVDSALTQLLIGILS
ncbi:hypothetical protein [Halorhabdus salina]|uniref:hypothetical protein n=1 Tax=Halorhabdus salina TaxID=2750670 RepID=UPI0015EF9700|nr:hypothetical protein [Halorhabdus salina]